jgi:hypothetical protein
MRTEFRNLYAAALLVGLLATAPVHGIEINVEDGKLLGASDVDIDGILFDVEFIDGSCASIFTDCGAPTGPGFLFDTDEQAEAASIALFDQLVSPIYFLGDPEVTSIDGCTAGTSLSWLDCYLVTPFKTTGGSFDARAVYIATSPGGFISNAPFSRPFGESGNNFVFAVWTRTDLPPVPQYSCVGFEPPANSDMLVRKPNRVLPLRMTLLDEHGQIVYDIAAPVVQIDYAGTHSYDTDDLEELNYAGRGDEGNMFQFDGSKWAFNLSTKGLARGEYTIRAVPGGDYAIDPTCELVVTIQ